MKILYLSPANVKMEFTSKPGDNKIFDLGSTSKLIMDGIKDKFEDIDITLVKDLVDENPIISNETLNDFDLLICDLTTRNSNVMYLAGQAEGIGKHIIYFVSNESICPVSLNHKRILKYSDASLNNEFKDELNQLISMVKKNPLDFSNSPEKTITKPKAFISYSHKNRTYLERLMVHLKPLTKKGLIDVWVDTKIKTGDQWEKEIEKALTESSIIILLISADFMASDFIVDNELPPLLSKAEVQGTKILPVIISPCRFSREKSLSRFQAANSPNEPLSAMSEDEREIIYDKLASEIEQSLANA